ncbi:hypothetical protein PPERSA_11968 [Pseudocohnilembus persalinus]|uniref:Uncharacterized protein n=1 Tax=Pseudocohnilembus persalinus TaxID=266149 RepID=A0A0V0QKC0_PSEPJ|nr:hypothetical protein PPERSA_11968 [Pseudocohnilembus persalinus]|eukprot:KRX02628.1 hypothetical protein PPERSA_11968 [Pseudocohnilembus persalinus]
MKTNMKYNEEQIKTLNPQQKMNFNSFFLGFSNGFVQKMAINFSSFNLEEIGNEFEGQVVCTMNPIQVEALKTREIMFDNLHLPGIVSLNYCQNQKYLIVSHRKQPFKLLEIFEYPLEFQTHLVEKFYPQFENKNLQQKKIDGDIIFLLTDEGDIMISKLKYAEINKENKLCFSPEKIFNLKRDNQAVPKKIAQSIIYESDYASVSLSDASFIIYNDIITQYYQSILD